MRVPSHFVSEGLAGNGKNKAPSGVFMEKKLKNIGFPYPHKHVSYKHMSHAVITKIPWIYKMAFKSERRHPEECESDRKDLRKELLEWVNSDWDRGKDTGGQS